METKYYISKTGAYLGAFASTELDGKVFTASPPAGSIEVPSAPDDARQPWLGDHWGEVPKETV